MDSRPHPKCVGQQFVREYYRIFNQAPQQIHRFYMENSTFKHGLLDGNIDCQVKIIQDEYQATLGNGIAVQVIGELSNSGQPIRRFTQSFVLAYQPPNNYFIGNEFLRYDDQTVTPVELQTVQPTTNAVVKALPEMSIVNDIANTDEVLIETPKLATAVPTTPVSPSVASCHLISQLVPAAKASIQTQQRAWKTKPKKPESVTPIKIENIEVVEEERVKSPTVESPIKQKEVLQPEPVTSNEIKKSSTSVKSAWKVPLKHELETASSTITNIIDFMAQRENNVRGMNRNDRPGPTTRGAPYTNEKNGKQSRLTGSNGVDGDRRRPSLNKYSDEQQLFLGNIPTYVTEEELKKLFTKFGNVIDVRIFINRNINNMPEDRIRNFGFIIFETIESAKSVLVEKRIILSDQNGDHRINVQEKKPRAKQVMDGSRIRESGNSMATGRNDAKGNRVEKNDNQVANNGQSGSGGDTGGSPKIRDGDTGRGMPRRGARGGSGGGRGRGGGNMPRGTDSRRN